MHVNPILLIVFIVLANSFVSADGIADKKFERVSRS